VNLVTRAVPARAEGGRITGPLAPVSFPEPGYIPMSWPLNWWQCGYNVLSAPPCSIVDACIWAYVRSIAQLPGYHKVEDDDGGVENVTTSALSRLLRFPNSYQTRSDFLTHGIRSLLYDGNWYSLAVRNARSEVAELHWLNPKLCRVYDVAVDGLLQHEIFYGIGNDGGNPILNPQELLTTERLAVVPARDILHIKLATPRHPLIGESWLAALAFDLVNRGSLSSGISAFIANASRPSGVILTDLTLTIDQVEELRAKWNAQTTGPNAGGTPILTSGLKWQQTSAGVNASDSQMIDALKLSDQQICGMFGVPGILVGVEDSKPFASTEALMNYWLANGLGYLLDHIEVQMDQFFGLPANEWTEYDTDALLRTELQVRIDALTRGVQGGIFSPNEARAREGYAAVEAGDEPRVQQQVIPLSFALGQPVPPAPPAPPPAATGNDNPPPPDESKEDRIKLLLALLDREDRSIFADSATDHSVESKYSSQARSFHRRPYARSSNLPYNHSPGPTPGTA
jgi:HK97 family phage portal protein